MAFGMVPCQVCGNDIDQDLRICPYCEEQQDLFAGLDVVTAPPIETPRQHSHPAAALQPSLRGSTPGCRAPLADGAFHKVVNLEAGRPIVETALRRLQTELATSRRENLRVLTIIHGYGSSGKGGVIGVECRKFLEYLKGSGAINTFIPGEDFSRRSGPTRDLLRRFPRLADNVNLNRGNRGITLVVL